MYIKKILSIYFTSFDGLSRDVWVLALANLINRAGSMLIPFMSLFLTKEIGLTKEIAGFSIMAFGFGSILGSYLGGWLADRFNFLYVQIGSLISSAVLLIPFINVSNLYGITALLFFFAVSADAFRPANAVAISHFSTPDTLTRSYSLMRLAYNLGFGIGPAIGGVVIAAFGFKWLFFIDGVTCLIAGILLFFYFIRRFKSAENTNQWNITKPQGMSAFKDGYFLAFVVSVVFFCLCFMQMFTSIPVHFAQDLQHSEMTVGLLLALNGILVFIIEMPIVAKYQNHPQKMNLISIGCGLMFVSYLFLLPFNKSLFFPVLFTFFITIAEIFAMPFMMNFVVNRPDPSRRGQYSSLYSIAFGLGFIFAPAIGLWIAEHYGFLTLFISVALLSFLPTFAFYKLGQKIKF